MTIQPSTTDTMRRAAQLAPHAEQLALLHLNHDRLCPATPQDDWHQDLLRSAQASLREGQFLERERSRIAARAAQAPCDVDGFVAWFEELQKTGPGQYDSLFDFLATRATFEQVRWFVQQEVAGEAGFDDLVALTQLRLPESAKLELARNYWDEMGRGKENGMHGPMLARLADDLEVRASEPSSIVWEALAVGNVLAGLAYNRRYAWHSLGALGAVELTAPTRAVRVVEALERVGVAGEALHYFKLHSTIDVTHWNGWRDHALIPVISAQPELTVHIAEGALMRLEAGARSYTRYKRELGL
ncbi:MAG TPA: iron-containing redox enzyme family protein [Polyangiales bacterium]|nr:iron-containing redox enzyme family protein [Polyangiales bacterium]